MPTVLTLWSPFHEDRCFSKAFYYCHFLRTGRVGNPHLHFVLRAIDYRVVNTVVAETERVGDCRPVLEQKGPTGGNSA